MLTVIFYIFAAITLLSALMVITQNNPVRCVLFLVLAFFSSSVLWILVNAEFLALILVLVYVGAVMTLFLFIVMMLNIDVESQNTHLLKYAPFGLVLVAFLASLLVAAIPATFPITKAQTVTGVSNTESLGLVLYTEYAYAFEIAAVILLAAIIAAITLIHRRAATSKRQSITSQIMTRPEDRLTIVQMKSENQR